MYHAHGIVYMVFLANVTHGSSHNTHAARTRAWIAKRLPGLELLLCRYREDRERVAVWEVLETSLVSLASM